MKWEEYRTSFPRVIILSATFLSSFARGTVVSMRSCRISCDTIVLHSICHHGGHHIHGQNAIAGDAAGGIALP